MREIGTSKECEASYYERNKEKVRAKYLAEHPNAKKQYTLEFKEEIVKYSRERGIDNAYLKYDINRGVIKRWMKKYQFCGQRIDAKRVMACLRRITEDKILCEFIRDDVNLRKSVGPRRRSAGISYSERAFLTVNGNAKRA